MSFKTTNVIERVMARLDPRDALAHERPGVALVRLGPVGAGIAASPSEAPSPSALVHAGATAHTLTNSTAA